MKNLLSIILVLLIISCDNSDKNNKEYIDISQGFEQLDASAAGFDEDKLNRSVTDISKLPYLYSILILKDGKQVIEYYSSKYSYYYEFEIRSVTKSVMSLLIGKAIDEKIIVSVNETIDGKLPNNYIIPENKKDIKIKHLLSMSSGVILDNPRESEFQDWWRSNNQIQFMLDLRVEEQHGQRFKYMDAAVHLLSVILTNKSKQSTLTYAKEKLFSPLNFSRYTWQKDKQGFYSGAADLKLTTRDLAKIGQLVLQKGRSGNNQIIPKKWIEYITKEQFSMYNSFGSIEKLGYASLWWTETGQAYEMYFAWGYGGQHIVVIPDYNLVVVTTANSNVEQSTSSEQAKTILNHIIDNIVESLN